MESQPKYEMFDPNPDLFFICPICHRLTPLVVEAATVKLAGMIWHLVISVCAECDHVWEDWLFKNPDAG